MQWQVNWEKKCNDYRQMAFKFAELTQVIKIKSSLTGEKIRLQLTNYYGVSDLTFQTVLVAKNSDFQAAQSLTYQGQTAITIPKGTSLLTDEISFPLTSGEDFYILMQAEKPQSYADVSSTFASEWENAALVRSCLKHPSLKVSSHFRKNWFSVGKVLILTEQQPQYVNVWGDSLIEMGFITQALRNLYLKQQPGEVVLKINGLSGNRYLYDALGRGIYKTFGASLKSRFLNYMMATKEQEINLVMIGTNDLVFPPSVSAASQQVISECMYVQTCRELSQRAPETLFTTILPVAAYLDKPTIQPEKIQTTAKLRQKINQALLKDRQLRVVDIQTNVSDVSQTSLLSVADFGDHLHVSQLGGELIAQTIQPVLTELLKHAAKNSCYTKAKTNLGKNG